MSELRVINPATGKLIETLPTDDRAIVSTKFRAAREAQRDWAGQALEQRLDALRRFRHAIVEQADALARTLTLEVGKPITQSRNELKGLVPRLDFFLQEAPRVLSRETVLT